jgi:hypothetical protein
VRRLLSQTKHPFIACCFLTGPHTFTARFVKRFTNQAFLKLNSVIQIKSPSPLSRAFASNRFQRQLNLTSDAVKASVPKLFGCPGAATPLNPLGLSIRGIAVALTAS